MLDKSIPYKSIIMRAGFDTLASVSIPALPEGYSFRLYRRGDAAHWAATEASVGEFASQEEALAYFQREFLPHEELLYQRNGYILAPDGTPVATATAWFEWDGNARRACLHWVSVRPQHQGLGLGRAIVAHAMRLLAQQEFGMDAYLHTQTWSHKAIGLYLRMGFHPLKDDPSFREKNDYFAARDLLLGVLPPETQRLFDKMSQ